MAIAEGWLELVRTHWEQEPAVLRAITPPIDLDDLFEATLALSAAYREQPVGSQFLRFFAEHGLFGPSSLEPYLPRPADRTLFGYAERLTNQDKVGQFGLILDNVQAHSAKVFLELREYLHALSGVVGISVGDSQVTSFIGTYGDTPFGVHADEASIFVFMLAGTKRMYLWHEDVWNARPRDRQRYRDYLDEAIVIEANPGDILYWPSTYWHVGESKGFSAAVHLPVFVKDRPIRSLALEAAQWALPEPPMSTIRDHFQDVELARTADLHADLRLAADALKEAVSSSRYEDALTTCWLERLSAFGFHQLPEPRESVRIRASDVVAADSRFPILTADLSNQRTLIAANGYSLSAARHSGLINAIESLNTGGKIEVSKLLNELDEPVAREARTVLEDLWRIRAIERFR